MRGIVSFHPVDPGVFSGIFDPLLAGRTPDAKPLFDAACRFRRHALAASRYARAVGAAVRDAAPPPLPTEGPLWLRIKARFDQYDHRPDPVAVRLAQRVDPDLHLYGRPFFIAEGSAEAVAAVIDEYLAAGGASSVESVALEQLAKLHPEAAQHLRPAAAFESPSDLPYRSRLTAAVNRLADLSRRVRRDGSKPSAAPFNARADGAIAAELAWRAVFLYSRSSPFWSARDVDGIETICGIAGVAAPAFVVPPFELFEASLPVIPALKPALGVELHAPRSVGAYIAPKGVLGLLDFLHRHGARIIQTATRHGEGPACAALLHKIRECACYASRHGMGYLEASGIDRVEDDWDPETGDDGPALARLLTDEVGSELVDA